MTSIVVSGLINLETTVRVDGFPIAYTPVRYPFNGIRSTVSGVGYNISRALTTLGHDITLLSLIGDDEAGVLIARACDRDGIAGDHLVRQLAGTAQSVILYDAQGRRQINVDLKDAQEQTLPEARAQLVLDRCDVAVLCNINFTRPWLAYARDQGKLVVTDVHAVSDLHDGYNRDYMAAASILFLSDESLPCSAEEWIRRVWDAYGTPIVVVGLGEDGCLLGVRADGFIGRIPAQNPRPVVNTIGAGDALLSAFVHSYVQQPDPYRAARRAVHFAGWKIGATGAADGFLTAAELDRLAADVPPA